jgi:hypothetical protein
MPSNCQSYDLILIINNTSMTRHISAVSKRKQRNILPSNIIIFTLIYSSILLKKNTEWCKSYYLLKSVGWLLYRCVSEQVLTAAPCQSHYSSTYCVGILMYADAIVLRHLCSVLYYKCVSCVIMLTKQDFCFKNVLQMWFFSNCCTMAWPFWFCPSNM